MELSKTETIALLVSNKEETVTGPIFIKSQSQHGWNLSLKGNFRSTDQVYID
jgi:hypothetical protein